MTFKLQLLVNGYIHEIDKMLKDEKIIPQGINQICFEYFRIDVRFPEKHESLIISNNQSTVKGTGLYHSQRGTVMVGDFIESGFLCVEFKLDKNKQCPGLCVIGKEFKSWKGFGGYEEDWFYAESLTICGKAEWTENIISQSAKFDLRYVVGSTLTDEIYSVMIDMDEYIGELRNKTRNQWIKFKLPQKACAIAVYCTDCQWTIQNVIFDREQY